ncbi:hypothetical protein K435DRAFT_861456 [Dendrothele bispora CBS 962.96]|uniref:Uncharacterized protein n=1 Tax=Dendrothele bispora (strain CBS 962.96) TaxID=1314807 RepID=A0A4S8LV95_DENBC|nr:hypothetical protein K435DRAFT_861456 [Dendrothele bispora CBS 962.96]
MPRNTQETRIKAYGEAALYLLGDRDAVLRQLNVLIAEALLGLGCEIPRSQFVPHNQRVLINTNPDSGFGCWYQEERLYDRNVERPYTALNWLNNPGEWQERAFRDPRVQTLIFLKSRAEWNPKQPCGEEPVGLPNTIVRLFRDRRHLMQGDVVAHGWSYLESPCLHFIKGRKTYAEREQNNVETPVIHPWRCTELLSLYRSYPDDRGRSSSPGIRADYSPPDRRSSFADSISHVPRHSSRCSYSPDDDERRSYSLDGDGDSLAPSSSPSPQKSISISRSGSYHRTQSRSAFFKKNKSRSRGLVNPFGESAASARRKGSASISSSSLSFSSHRSNSGKLKYKGSTRPMYPTLFGASTLSPRGKSSASIASSSSSFSSHQSSDSGKYKGSPLRTSPTFSTSLDSDSDLPSMEDLLQEFPRKWVVIGIIWFTAGQHGEPFLITVTNGKVCLEDQQSQLRKLGVGPDSELERLDCSWKRLFWWEMFSVKEEEKVYLRVAGVGYGMGMPNPDVIEFQDTGVGYGMGIPNPDVIEIQDIVAYKGLARPRKLLIMDTLIGVPAELIIAIASLCHRKTRRALAETNRRHCQLVQPLVFQALRISSITQLRHLVQFLMTREDIRRRLTFISIKARSLSQQEYDVDDQGDIIIYLKQLLNSSRVQSLCFEGLGGNMHGLSSDQCYLVKPLVEIVNIAVERGLKVLKIIDSMMSVWSMVDLLLVLGDHHMDALELVCCAPTLTSRDVMDVNSFDADKVVSQVSDYLDRQVMTRSTKKLCINAVRLFGCDFFCAIIAAYVKAVGCGCVVSIMFWCQKNAILSWWLEVMAKREGLIEGLETIWMLHPGVGYAMSFISESLANISRLNYGLRCIAFTVVDRSAIPICLRTVSLKNDYLKIMWTDYIDWIGIGAEIGRSAFWNAIPMLHSGHLDDPSLLKELFLQDQSRLDGWSSQFPVQYLRTLVALVERSFNDGLDTF